MPIRPVKLAALLCLAAFAPATLAQPVSDRNLPADVDAESLSRLPLIDPGALDAEGRRVYGLVVGDGPQPRTGPAAVSMVSPAVAEGFHLLNDYLRRRSLLEPRDYEVAILVAAWEFEQRYEWAAHEAAARRVGVPDAVIDAIKHDGPVEGLGARDSLIVRFARSLLRDHELGSALYAETVEAFGEQGLVELATIIGDYVMVGLVLTAVDQHLPENFEDTLPER